MVRGSSGGAIAAGKASVIFGGDTTALQQALRGTEMQLQAWGQRIQKLGRTMMAAGIAGAALFIKPIREAATVEQLLGRFDAVFGEFSKSAGEYADQLAKKINQSGLTIRDQMAQFNAYLKGIGFEPAAANAISRQLVEWTNDWIAFDDTIVNGQEAVDLFLSALSGEVRPARRMGADLRVLALDALAMSKGLGKASKDLTEVQRVQLRMESIFTALTRSGVIGQAEREVKTLAAEFRGFKGAMRDMTVAVGMAIIKPFTEILRKMKEVVRWFERFAKIHPQVVEAFARISVVAIGLGAAFLILGKAMAAMKLAQWLKTMIALEAAIIANPIAAGILAVSAAVVAMTASVAIANTPLEQYTEAWKAFKEEMKYVMRSVNTLIKAGEAMKAVTISWRGLKGAMAEFFEKLDGFAPIGAAFLFWLEAVETILGQITWQLRSMTMTVDNLAKKMKGITLSDAITELAKEFLKRRAERWRAEREAATAAAAAQLPVNPRVALQTAARGVAGAGIFEPTTRLATQWFEKIAKVASSASEMLYKLALAEKESQEAARQWGLLTRAFTMYGPFGAPVKRQVERPFRMGQDFLSRLPGQLYDMSKPWFAWIEKNQLEFFGRPSRYAAPGDFRAQVGFGAIGGTLQAMQVSQTIQIEKEQLEEQKKIKEGIERTNKWLEKNKGIPIARG